MATGLELVNKGVCGGVLAGYNMAKGCSVPLENIKEIWRTPQDFQFDLTQQFDEAYIKSLQLAGNLSIIKNITDFPENGTDPLIFTTADNTETSAGEAKYKYSPVWLQDLWLNVQLGKLEGQYNNRFCFVDEAGNILMTEGSDATKSRGFLTSRTKRAKVILQSPGVGAQQSLEFQLANSIELEDNKVIFAFDALDFNPRLIEPIIQAYVSYNVVPADTDTSVQVKVVLDKGRKDVVTGLVTSGDFKVTINGTDEAEAVATESPDGTYTITTTALAAGQKVDVQINGVKEVSGDGLYVSNKASITVV